MPLSDASVIDISTMLRGGDRSGPNPYHTKYLGRFSDNPISIRVLEQEQQRQRHSVEDFLYGSFTPLPKN